MIGINFDDLIILAACYALPILMIGMIAGAKINERSWRRRVDSSDMQNVPMIVSGRAFFIQYIGDGKSPDAVRFKKAENACAEMYNERPPRMSDYPWANVMGRDIIVSKLAGRTVKRPGSIYVKCSAGCRWDHDMLSFSIHGDRFYLEDLTDSTCCPMCGRTDRYDDVSDDFDGFDDLDLFFDSNNEEAEDHT